MFSSHILNVHVASDDPLANVCIYDISIITECSLGPSESRASLLICLTCSLG